MTSPDDLIRLEGGRTVVYRRGDVLIRETGPWAPAVHALLRHLEQAAFAAAPRLVGSGLDQDGRETLTFIDGEFTQPGPLIELAQLCWLNAKLHDDIVAQREHLPPAVERARQLAAMVDAYGLTAAQRRGFVDQMIQFAICDTAWEADDAAITPETTAHAHALWAMAWRARSAAWMIRHRRILETALAR